MDARTLSNSIGILAERALREEVCATPKPGLVDRIDSGAHRDMDITTFLTSAQALRPYLIRFAEIGVSSCGAPPSLFGELCETGKQAEEAMLLATAGANTHKGAIFSLGLACAAAGYCLRDDVAAKGEDILLCCREIAAEKIARDFAQMSQREPLSHGEKTFARYGAKGIRGEVETGFATVRSLSLPALEELLQGGMPWGEALIQTLLYLIANMEDTNVLYRAGPEALRYAQTYAREVLELGGMRSLRGRALLADMNRDFIAQNISPGGCADMLALTILIHSLQSIGQPQPAWCAEREEYIC
ncbi:MAG: triphosphoribosyl-dephospho-CoA synthase CitG [Christensenella sp.]|nr:triphosphoribosyl-dephospho-CoA synthase CitG [Christensenella sp.]